MVYGATNWKHTSACKTILFAYFLLLTIFLRLDVCCFVTKFSSNFLACNKIGFVAFCFSFRYDGRMTFQETYWKKTWLFWGDARRDSLLGKKGKMEIDSYW